MKTEKGTAKIGRRGFLKQAGVAVGTAGVAAVVSTQAPAASETADTKSTGYRETEHVRTYYELARF